MNFSCSGNISKWTFVANSRTGEGRNQYPLFQLWRPDGTRRYRRVYESNITSTMSDQSEFTVEEYMPDTPVPFEAGDIFGVDRPEESCRRLSVVYVDVPPGYGYDNYYGECNSDQFNKTTDENNYPLVSVNTSEYQQILAEKSGTLQTTCSVLSQASSFFKF